MRIKQSAHKLGNSIEAAKPYYESRIYAAQVSVALCGGGVMRRMYMPPPTPTELNLNCGISSRIHKHFSSLPCAALWLTIVPIASILIRGLYKKLNSSPKKHTRLQRITKRPNPYMLLPKRWYTWPNRVWARSQHWIQPARRC